MPSILTTSQPRGHRGRAPWLLVVPRPHRAGLRHDHRPDGSSGSRPRIPARRPGLPHAPIAPDDHPLAAKDDCPPVDRRALRRSDGARSARVQCRPRRGTREHRARDRRDGRDRRAADDAMPPRCRSATSSTRPCRTCACSTVPAAMRAAIRPGRRWRWRRSTALAPLYDCPALSAPTAAVAHPSGCARRRRSRRAFATACADALRAATLILAEPSLKAGATVRGATRRSRAPAWASRARLPAGASMFDPCRHGARAMRADRASADLALALRRLTVALATPSARTRRRSRARRCAAPGRSALAQSCWRTTPRPMPHATWRYPPGSAPIRCSPQASTTCPSAGPTASTSRAIS